MQGSFELAPVVPRVGLWFRHEKCDKSELSQTDRGFVSTIDHYMSFRNHTDTKHTCDIGCVGGMAVSAAPCACCLSDDNVG